MEPLDLHRENVFATGRSWRGETGFPSADSTQTVVHEYVLSPVRDEENRITSVMASLRDISERKQEAASLQDQVLHDHLTRLPNRTLLYDRAQQGLFASERHHASLAVLLMDLDQFKEVNDSFGHAAGDLLLQSVGPRWKGSLRTTDTLARLGGDEFVVLLPDIGRDGARAVVQKLASTTTEGFSIEERTLRVGVSIGVAVYPDDETGQVGWQAAAPIADQMTWAPWVSPWVTDSASLRGLAHSTGAQARVSNRGSSTRHNSPFEE